MAPLNWQLTTIKERYMRNANLVENALLQGSIAPQLCHSGGQQQKVHKYDPQQSILLYFRVKIVKHSGEEGNVISQLIK